MAPTRPTAIFLALYSVPRFVVVGAATT